MQEKTPNSDKLPPVRNKLDEPFFNAEFENAGNIKGVMVKKSNALARASWHPDSIWEMRILALLISKLRIDDAAFRTIEIPAIELLRDEHRKMKGGEQWSKILEAAKSLIGKVVTYHDSEAQKFIGRTFFTTIKIERGLLTAKFNADIMPELLQLRNHFCKQDLFLLMTTRSTHTLQLYDLLTSWSDKPTFIISINELQKKLNAPVSSIKNFSNFEQRFLRPAQKALKDSTVEFIYTVEKRARRISEITFYFIKKKDQRRIKKAPKKTSVKALPPSPPAIAANE
jgi:hypothetical protein